MGGNSFLQFPYVGFSLVVWILIFPFYQTLLIGCPSNEIIDEFDGLLWLKASRILDNFIRISQKYGSILARGKMCPLFFSSWEKKAWPLLTLEYIFWLLIVTDSSELCCFFASMEISLKRPFPRVFLEWFCFISSLYFIKLETTVLSTAVVVS